MNVWIECMTCGHQWKGSPVGYIAGHKVTPPPCPIPRCRSLITGIRRRSAVLPSADGAQDHIGAPDPAQR